MFSFGRKGNQGLSEGYSVDALLHPPPLTLLSHSPDPVLLPGGVSSMIYDPESEKWIKRNPLISGTFALSRGGLPATKVQTTSLREEAPRYTHEEEIAPKDPASYAAQVEESLQALPKRSTYRGTSLALIPPAHGQEAQGPKLLHVGREDERILYQSSSFHPSRRHASIVLRTREPIIDVAVAPTVGYQEKRLCAARTANGIGVVPIAEEITLEDEVVIDAYPLSKFTSTSTSTSTSIEIFTPPPPPVAMTFHPKWPGELAMVNASGSISIWQPGSSEVIKGEAFLAENDRVVPSIVYGPHPRSIITAHRHAGLFTTDIRAKETVSLWQPSRPEGKGGDSPMVTAMNAMDGYGLPHYMAIRTQYHLGIIDVRWSKGFADAWESLGAWDGGGVLWLPPVDDRRRERTGILVDWAVSSGDAVAYSIPTGGSHRPGMYGCLPPSYLPRIAWREDVEGTSASSMALHASGDHGMGASCLHPQITGAAATTILPRCKSDTTVDSMDMDMDSSKDRQREGEGTSPILCLWQGSDNGGVWYQQYSWGVGEVEEMRVVEEGSGAGLGYDSPIGANTPLRVSTPVNISIAADTNGAEEAQTEGGSPTEVGTPVEMEALEQGTATDKDEGKLPDGEELEEKIHTAYGFVKDGDLGYRMDLGHLVSHLQSMLSEEKITTRNEGGVRSAEEIRRLVYATPYPLSLWEWDPFKEILSSTDDLGQIQSELEANGLVGVPLPTGGVVGRTRVVNDALEASVLSWPFMSVLPRYARFFYQEALPAVGGKGPSLEGGVVSTIEHSSYLTPFLGGGEGGGDVDATPSSTLPPLPEDGHWGGRRGRKRKEDQTFRSIWITPEAARKHGDVPTMESPSPFLTSQLTPLAKMMVGDWGVNRQMIQEGGSVEGSGLTPSSSSQTPVRSKLGKGERKKRREYEKVPAIAFGTMDSPARSQKAAPRDGSQPSRVSLERGVGSRAGSWTQPSGHATVRASTQGPGTVMDAFSQLSQPVFASQEATKKKVKKRRTKGF